MYSLGDDLKACRNLKYLPLTSYPSYIQLGAVIRCTKGNAKIDVNGNMRRLGADELLILLPGQLVSLTEISDDFLVNGLLISKKLFDDILSGIPRFSPYFFFYMRSHYWYQLSKNNVVKLETYFRLIKGKVLSKSPFRYDSILNLFRYFYLEIYTTYQDGTINTDTRFDTRKEELTNKFFNLLMENYRENRDVAYYADKLCISPKYLSMIIKETSGSSAKDWILEYVILEVKALLKNTTLNIQEISLRTNFSNQSSLGRFFRKHTGMSLSEYRAKNIPKSIGESGD